MDDLEAGGTQSNQVTFRERSMPCPIGTSSNPGGLFARHRCAVAFYEARGMWTDVDRKLIM